MSELPAINHEKVAARLATRLADCLLQNTQLEALAESLRDERDAAMQNYRGIQGRLDAALENKTPEETT